MLSDGVIGNEDCMISAINRSYNDDGYVNRNDEDGDGHSTCSTGSNDTNECVEFFLGLKKNTITLNDMKDVIDDVDDDGSRSNRLDCLTNEHNNMNVSTVRGKAKVKESNDLLLMGTNNDGANENDEMRATPTTMADDDDNHRRSWYSNAYRTSTTSQGLSQGQKHVVRIALDHSNQYYSLVATAKIPSGTILYTERPLFSTQIPSLHMIHLDRQPHEMSTHKEHSDHTINNNTVVGASRTKDNDNDGYYDVRACQFCFRSLEPISSCYNCSRTNHDKKSLPNQEHDVSLLLPLQHLYPIPDFHFLPETTKVNHDTTASNGASPYRKDQYGRIQCTVCRSYFCSEQCYDCMMQQYGSCCTFIQHLQLIASSSTSVSSPSANHLLENNKTGINDIRDVAIRSENEDEQHDNDDSDPLWEAMGQPAVALAVRMFVATLHLHRSTATLLSTNAETTTSSNAKDSCSFMQSIVEGLCGTAQDVQLLELGLPMRANTNQNYNSEEIESMITTSATVDYTVEPIYDVLVRIHSITKVEQASQFTLMYFMSLCSKAARNGFGVRPQSPFQSYYAGIVRSSLYRGSTQHAKLQNQVANALLGCASSDAKFERGMDRMVDERVCPEVVALYPLTSRINHSCVPNSEVQSQQYIDNTIDIVAIKDINIGEEITISYIYGTGDNCGGNTTQRNRNHKATHRRQRELFAKYLFHCDCVLCKNERT